MKKILASGFLYENKKEFLGTPQISERLRLVVNTDYKNVTKKFEEKLSEKIKELGYIGNVNVTNYGWLVNYKINEWNQLDYTQEGASGSIPLDKLVEITIKK